MTVYVPFFKRTQSSFKQGAERYFGRSSGSKVRLKFDNPPEEPVKNKGQQAKRQ